MDIEKYVKVGHLPGPPTTVDGIILLKNGQKLLLIQRDHDPFMDKWALPGGFIDFDESTTEAVIREVKEETNLDIKDVYFINYYDNQNRDSRARIVISFSFVAFTNDCEKAKCGDDAKSLKWVTEDELIEMINHNELAFDHKKFILDAMLKTNYMPQIAIMAINAKS